jgi:phosphoribosylanthranilate isomerase
MRVKFCGITNQEDALRAADLGVDALGFIFTERSPRHVRPELAARIIERLPPFVVPVGVFVDPDERDVRRLVRDCGLGLIQLHGNETPDLCRRLGPSVLKAVRVQDNASLNKMIPYKPVRAFVLDTFREDQAGGTGQKFDWDLAVQAKKFGPIILAGGLTPDNVRQAMLQVRPVGLDVASGIEAQVGKKDRGKMQRFIQAVRAAEREIDEAYEAAAGS